MGKRSCISNWHPLRLVVGRVLGGKEGEMDFF